MGNLVQRYRPRQFADFRGQDTAIKQIAGLIRPLLAGRPKIERHLLLCGEVGTGKTSLAEVFDDAMNCESNLPDMSPCLQCPACKGTDAPERRFFRYDVPNLGGGKEKISNYVREVSGAPSTGYKILFFDEAHALTPEGADALLGPIEHACPGLIYVFATTEPQRIRPALRSRLMRIEFHPLDAEASFQLLRDVCEAENISATGEALSVIAAVSQGRARDLLHVLEQVWTCYPDMPISGEDVEAVLGCSPRAMIVAFLTALARGRRQDQAEIIRKWPGNLEELLRHVRNLLTAIYFNNINGLDLHVEALAHSIQADRDPILTAFRARLAPGQPLSPVFAKILTQLAAHAPPRDASDCLMQLAILSEEVNAAMAQENILYPQASPEPSGDVVPFDDGDFDDSGSIATKWEGKEPFLEPDDAVDLIGQASYFAQEFGRGFNAFVEMTLGALDGSQTARERADELLRDLASLHAASSGVPFAYIAVLERQGDVFTLLASLHTSAGVVELQERLAGSPDRLCSVKKDDLPLSMVPQDLQFHWAGIRRMCAGLPTERGEWESSRGLIRPLRSLLTLGPPDPRRWPLSACLGGLWTSSANINAASIARARKQKLAPLSAILDNAFRYVFNSWELSEFLVRSKIKRERRLYLSELDRLFSSDPERLYAERAAYLSALPDSVTTWSRPWQVWWRSR